MAAPSDPTRTAAEPPLVSMITIVRNAEATLATAMDSVLGQTVRDFEYLVIDGASTDGTVDVIRRYADRLAFWISEPDRGPASAQNKAIARARGRYVAYCYADDWLEPTFLERTLESFARNSADFVFGDLVMHEAGLPARRVAGDPDYARRLGRTMPHVNFPSMTVRRDLYKRVGGFNESFFVAPDYEWVLRAHRSGAKGAYCADAVVNMRAGGLSHRRYRQGLAEVARASILHGGSPLAAYAALSRRWVGHLGLAALRRVAPPSVVDAVRRVCG